MHAGFYVIALGAFLVTHGAAEAQPKHANNGLIKNSSTQFSTQSINPPSGGANPPLQTPPALLPPGNPPPPFQVVSPVSFLPNPLPQPPNNPNRPVPSGIPTWPEWKGFGKP